jgi:hypothetical protein
MLRRIGGSLAGVAAAVLVIVGIEAIGHRVTGAPSDPAQATPAMMAWVLVAWTVGTAAGALVGVKLARWKGAAWFPAALVLFGVVMTALAIPSPWWLTVGGIVLPLLAAALVSRRAAAADQRVAL